MYKMRTFTVTRAFCERHHACGTGLTRFDKDFGGKLVVSDDAQWNIDNIGPKVISGEGLYRGDQDDLAWLVMVLEAETQNPGKGTSIWTHMVEARYPDVYRRVMTNELLTDLAKAVGKFMDGR